MAKEKAEGSEDKGGAKEKREKKAAAKGEGVKVSASAPIKIQLKEKYKNDIVPALVKELGLKGRMQVPTLKKIVLNVSTSEAVRNPKVLNTAADELAAITGQKAVITKSKKSISNFKLREGMPIGATVTLRKDRMWTFLER